MTSITKKMILTALTEIVAEHGAEYVYNGGGGCLYVKRGQPSCGVGVALSTLGVPTDVLRKMDNNYETSIISQHPQKVLKTNGFTMTPAAVVVADKFQKAQDRGVTWGYALDYATLSPLR